MWCSGKLFEFTLCIVYVCAMDIVEDSNAIYSWWTEYNNSIYHNHSSYRKKRETIFFYKYGHDPHHLNLKAIYIAWYFDWPTF